MSNAKVLTSAESFTHPLSLKEMVVVKTMEAIEANRSADHDKELPHRHDFFTLIWVKEGKGKHFIDFNDFSVMGQQLFFIAPGQMHLLEMETAPKGWVLMFRKDFLPFIGEKALVFQQRGLFQMGSLPLATCDAPFSDIAEPIFQRLVALLNTATPFRLDWMGAYVRSLLMECLYLVNAQNPNPTQAMSSDQRIFLSFQSLIESNYQTLHKVKDYAEKLFLSPNYLNDVIKKVSGKTAKNWIKDRLLNEAQRSALHTDCTVQEITFFLGFKDPAYFSRFFKRSTGQTFQEYRKSIRSNYL